MCMCMCIYEYIYRYITYQKGYNFSYNPTVLFVGNKKKELATYDIFIKLYYYDYLLKCRYNICYS